MPSNDLIVLKNEGLYCPVGGFFIDPWRPVSRAVITHAHADHARAGHASYLAHKASEGILRTRIGADISLQNLEYGERVTMNGVTISLHPAGHVLGSAQVRVEHEGRVWVASGDYKVAPDATCEPFEAVLCDTFITESTFGLPIYRWRDDREVFAEINEWWAENRGVNRPTMLACYSFGKAQRILSGLDASIGLIIVHGAVDPLNKAYRAAGVALPETKLVSEVIDKAAINRALVLCPPSASASTWANRFKNSSVGFASGWMQLRGRRRMGGYDRGFVLSDHADWPGLQSAIKATQASRVIVTHGYEAVMTRWLTEQGLEAGSFKTEYGDDAKEDAFPLPMGEVAA
jgi:putative mRNA 3-end processing factor